MNANDPSFEAIHDTANAQKPLLLHWWKGAPNFGDALSPHVVAHLSGRRVVHAGAGKAELYAIGSLVQVVRRAAGRWAEGLKPSLWGAGLLHEIGSLDFLRKVHVALLRGPITAKLLGLNETRFGDAGLLAPDVFKAKTRGDVVGIVPHHSVADDPLLNELAARDPAIRIIDPRGDVPQICRMISSCARILASSLHGLIVADAYGVPNTWIAAKGQTGLKFRDYAASVGRTDMNAPIALADALLKKPNMLDYADGIAQCRDALYSSFPDHLKAA